MRNTFCALLIALLGLSACTTAPHAKRVPVRSMKEVYVDELLTITPPIVMLEQMAEPRIPAYISQHKREKVRSNFIRNVDAVALDAIVRDAFMKNFTEKELKALVEFCRTPEGRDCMTKMAPFAAKVVPACVNEATRAYRQAAIDAASGMLFP